MELVNISWELEFTTHVSVQEIRRKLSGHYGKLGKGRAQGEISVGR